MTKKPRKVCILGTAYSGPLAPCWDDPTWEVWGSSRVQHWVTRRDRWFEVHNLEHLKATQGQEWHDKWIQDMLEFEKRVPCPLHMFYPRPDLFKDVHEVRREPIEEKYGTFFLTSSMAWQLAIFLEEVAPNGKAPKGTELAMYGVELDQEVEYRAQRAGVRHFVQLARHFGVEVKLWNAGGIIYEPTPYPFWTEEPLRDKLRFRLGKNREEMESLIESRNTARQKYFTTKGRLLELVECGNQDQKRIEALQKELDQIQETGEKVQNNIEKIEGHQEELQYMMDYLSP